jgi:hypothetical protein
VSRSLLARLFVLAGLGAFGVGAWLEWGRPVALMVAGVELALFGLVCVDVDPLRPDDRGPG